MAMAARHERGMIGKRNRTNRSGNTKPSQNEDESVLLALLKGFMEALFHQLLYVRRVYPTESFTSTTVLDGVTCRVNRHPQVVQYIAETVEMAAKLLMQQKVKEVSLSILSDTLFTTEETFVLETWGDAMPTRVLQHMENEQDRWTVQHFERIFRNILLSAYGLEACASPVGLGDQTSFRIVLGTHPTKRSAAASKPGVAAASVDGDSSSGAMTPHGSQTMLSMTPLTTSPEGWYTPSSSMEYGQDNDSSGSSKGQKRYRQLFRDSVDGSGFELSMIDTLRET